MRNRLLICGVALIAVLAGARVEGQDFNRMFATGNHYSLSGQFVIHDPPVVDWYPYYPASASNYMRLDPTLLTVSCERIKHALLTELGARDQWQGKIFLDLYHTRNPDDAIVVNPTLMGSQWSYRVALPDFLERDRVVSVVVQTVMLEIANRNAGRSAEIPAWLAEGMTRQVIRSSHLDLVLEPPLASENGVTLRREDRSIRRTSLLQDGAWGLAQNLGKTPNADPIAQALDTLREIAPLSLDELSWPRDGQFDGQAGEAYRCSAQLFVHELLQLKDGPAKMQAFLPELSRHLNWQISFLAAFQPDFASQLELSKWWALRLVQLTGRDLFQAWSDEESWNHLDEVLNPTIQIRSSAADLPKRGRVTLETAIKDLDLTRQKMLLPETARQLAELRNRVAPGLVNLVDDYRRVLGGYLYQRDHGAIFPMGKERFESHLDDVARETIRELQALDQVRLRNRPKQTAAQPSPQPVAAIDPTND
jgi:hypothetical protein